MRDRLKKIVDGAEAALGMLLWGIFWTLISPIIALRWLAALWCSAYHYCKIPELTFIECLRYEMADSGTLGEVESFDFCYFPRKPFDIDEYVRVRGIIRDC